MNLTVIISYLVVLHFRAFGVTKSGM